MPRLILFDDPGVPAGRAFSSNYRQMNNSNPVILLVDDNVAGRYAMRRILQTAGFTVVEAGSGSEAFESLNTSLPDLILLDVNLPDMLGFDVCEQVKNTPATASIPVVMISSASIHKNDRVRGLEGGADGYLVQPVEPEVLIATVNAYLRIRRAEEALRSSAQRWRTTFNAINDGVALLDAEGRVMQCNEALPRILGVTRDDIIGTPYHELLHIPIDSIQETPFIRTLRSRQREMKYVAHGERWFHVTTDPVADDDIPAGAVCIISDVTEERRIEQQLEQRFAQLQSIYQISNSVSRAGELEQIYDDAFEGMEKTLGVRRASILLIDPDGVMRFKAWRGVSDGYRANAEGHSPWTRETRDPEPITVSDAVIDPSLGELRSTILNEGIEALAFIPLTFDGRLLGKFMLYYEAPHEFNAEEIRLARTIASHVSLAIVRKRTEEELRLGEERLRLALDAAHMGNFDWNLQTGEVIWSSSLVRMHGGSVDMERGIDAYIDTVHPDDRGALTAAIRRSIEEGESYESEYRVIRPDGALRWIEGKGRVFTDDDGLHLRMAGVCTDITDRKRFEAARNIEYEITNILAQSDTLAEAAPRILRSVCEGAGWEVGTFWNLEREARVLCHVDTWRSPAIRTDATTAPDGTHELRTAEGFPVRIVEQGKPLWFADCGAPSLPPPEPAVDMKSCFGFPIWLGNDILGVIEYRSVEMREPDEELLKTARTIGSHIGQFIERKRAEAELRRSRDQLEIIFQGVADGITAQDVTGEVIFANEAAARLSGFESPREFVATPMAQVMARFDIRDEFGEPYPLEQMPGRQALKQKRKVERLLRFRLTATGQEEWSVVKSTPVLDEHGEVQYIINIFNSITDRVRRAEELRASEVRYRTLMEQSPLGIQIFSADGYCISANRSWEEMWGTSRDTLEGYNILQDEEAQRKGIMPYILRAFDGETVSIPPVLYDPGEIGREGRARWIRAFLYAVRDDNGNVREVVMKVEDVTDRIEAEAALFELNQTLGALAEASPLAIMVLDPQGRLKLWNPAAERMFGWTAEEVIGRQAPVILEERMDEFRDKIRNTLAFHPLIGTETIHLRKDGSIINVGIWTAPLRDTRGEPYAVMVVIADITQRIRSERERAELLRLEQSAREEAETARQRFAFLAEASEVLASSLDYQRTLTGVARLAVPHVADWCAVDVVAENGDVERLAVAHVDREKVEWALGIDQEPADPDARSGVQRVLHTGRSEFYPEITDDMLVAAAASQDHLDLMRRIGFSSVMIVPIVARDRVHGAITFVSAESEKHFDSADLTLAEDLARRAAVAIDNARLYEEAQEELAERKRTESALRRSEELNRAVLNSMAAHISVLDKDADIIAVNEAWERFAGENDEGDHLARTGVGENYLDICRRSTGACSEEAMLVAGGLEKILRGESASFSLEYPCHSPEEQRWFLLNITPLSRESGGAVISHLNITQRKMAEEQVRNLLREVDEQRMRLKDLIANVPGAVWEARGTPVFQRVTFVSDYVENMLGYTVEEWAQSEDFWRRIVHPDDLKRMEEESAEVIAGTRNMQRFRAVAKDGQVRWIEAHEVGVYDEQGNPIGMRGVSLDVTEREVIEEKLRESEERFRTMADSAPVLLWIADDRNRGTYFNRVWLEFTGRSMEQEIDTGWTEGIHPDDLAAAVATCSRAFNRHEEFRMEFRLRRFDGEYRWVLDHGVPRVTPDGTFVGYIGSCIDITDQKEIEKSLERRVHERTAELEAANRELESFSYSVSHDLRAPLRSIDGFSKALLEDYIDSLDTTGQDYLKRVRASSQRMGQLIDDMLNLSRVTRSEMIREEVDVSQMAQQIVNELRGHDPERIVDVRITPNMTINGDARLLHVVLENLLGNAWKFTGSRPDARVEFGVENQGGTKVYFVRDNGAGFDMAYVNKLFTPFQRLHSIEQFQGTGVGLATVQRIIKRHGGRIWTDAKPNQGATFYFTFS